jgi:hypothetical protein
MEASTIWFLKLIVAHLLTDFILQPSYWVDNRVKKHFGSIYLYLHGLITAAVAYLFIGQSYWVIVIVIFVSHILIDGWKSYRKPNLLYFFIDQSLHLAVITGCYYFTFSKPGDILSAWHRISTDGHFWKLVLAVVFLTLPAGILIGLLTRQWREKIGNVNQESLSNAGKWIGIAERIIVLILVLHGEYAAIGLLVAAKSILRFNEKDRPEIKTEYLVIGTLLSIGLAIITGVTIR